MQFDRFNQRQAIVAGVVFVVLVIGIFLLPERNRMRVQSGFLGMISPFLKQGSGLEKKIRDYREGLKTLKELEDENRRLRVVNQELSATNQTLRKLEEENNSLRSALAFRERAAFQLMPARVIARDASTWYQKIIIDRGSEEAIEPDMPVLTEEGLVGKTTVVSEHSSIVILISDENCRVSATVEGTRESGIVKGERAISGGVPTIGLGFLSKTANLQPGMNVYTSGVGGVFPSGVSIGKISTFKVRELDGYATLVPSVDLSNIEHVFVVVSERPPEAVVK